MPRCQIALEPLQDPPPLNVGQENIKRYGMRLVFTGQSQGGGPQRRYQALHALFASRVEQEAGKAHIVFNNQQDAIARLNVIAIIVRFVDEIEIGWRCHGHWEWQAGWSSVSLADRRTIAVPHAGRGRPLLS